MANKEEKSYLHNGKVVKIVPARKSRSESGGIDDGEKVKAKRGKKEDTPTGVAKFAIGDKVTLKNVPPEYSGGGFTESVIIKVFKSSQDQSFRYAIRSITGHEMTMVREDQLKPRKINFKK